MAKKSRSTRRDFLRGKSAVDALAELPDRLLPATADASPSDASPTTRQDASYLIQIARDAMACEFQIFLNAVGQDAGTEAALAALDRVEALEDQLSVYRDHSEVSAINRRAAQDEVVVERGLFDLLQTALELHRETNGAFDITAGPLTKTWGFHRRAGRFPEPAEVQKALSEIGSRYLELSAERQSVRFNHPRLEINVNAIGKGYALDQAAQQLVDEGVQDFLMHGGRSSILARGSRRGLTDERQGWSIALRHPLRHDRRLAEIWLLDQALGTSGSGNQFFHFQGKRYGHVIDPRTGYPADHLLSATVIAPTGTQADALATAAFVMGLEETLEYAASHPAIGVLLAATATSGEEIELHTSGLPDEQWQRL